MFFVLRSLVLTPCCLPGARDAPKDCLQGEAIPLYGEELAHIYSCGLKDLEQFSVWAGTLAQRLKRLQMPMSSYVHLHF